MQKNINCKELLDLRENYQFEVKSAQGRSGNGEVPRDIWESYSSMANSEGGLILLGAKELKDGSLEFLGIKDIEKVQKEFWTTINNKLKINLNILSPTNLKVLICKNKSMLLIEVPQASRKQRPIYTGSNPLTGTYLRYHDSDIKAKDDIVRSILADAVNDSNDISILNCYNMSDIDMDSLNSYRNLYRSAKGNHPWAELNDKEFLIQLGGYATNRVSKKEGLTIAGLLMFGKLRSILDGIPNYLVDYQEQTENIEDRWIDRITTDGNWSGNLFEFAQKVFRKLTAELKIPFRLEDSFQRVDETHIHEAIREALINTLIHSNYHGHIGILIIKHPKGYSFRNPGLLRITKEEVFKGGKSDCRNRTLQKMFQYIGMGEQAGSGFPKMIRAWTEQHWQYPNIEEDRLYETTTLFLPTISLFPKDIHESLNKKYENRYNSLDHDSKLALILAHVEKEVSNTRFSAIAALHPTDSTKILRKLVVKGLLVSEGIGRGTKYSLQDDNSRLQHKETTSLQHKQKRLQHKDEDIEVLSLAEKVRNTKRVDTQLMTDAILELCSHRYLTASEIASFLSRDITTIRSHYLSKMVKKKLLELKYEEVNHQNQAYRTQT